MQSKIAHESRRALLNVMLRMTPEQRLNAFLAHCQAMAQLKAAGERVRAVPQRSKS
jgi:hypothetical protein